MTVDPEDAEFFRWYGPWAALDPAGVAEFMAGFARPWLIDLPITPDRDGLWTSKRWAEHVAPLDEVTWVAETGIRYVNPEIALHYKARLNRPKDNLDLDRTLPLLGPEQRAWLRDAVRRTEPGHPWLARL